jgi:hypothetical protein
MASVDFVEKMLSGMMNDQREEDQRTVNKFAKDAGWAEQELDHWKQRCEELEIELECIRNAFPEHDNDILPKHRGIL